MEHHDIPNKSCGSWPEFREEFMSTLYTNGQFNRGQYLFRGQRRSEWSLESSFDRAYRSVEPGKRQKLNKELLDEFKKEAEHVDLPDGLLSDELKLIALAQHSGLPTRLLDWTESPYVASFFAFSDLASSIDADGDCAVWALKASSSIWAPELGVQIVRVSSIGNIRLRNQSGVFTLSRTPFTSLEEYVKHAGAKESPILSFTIPSDEAPKALADLDAMGVNHTNLFPGLEGCAMSAKMRVILRSDLMSP